MGDNTQTKQCRKCRVEKPFAMFHKSKKERHGIDGECRECASNRRIRDNSKCMVCGGTIPKKPWSPDGHRKAETICSTTCRAKRKFINAREWNLRWKYGLTDGDYQRMLDAQGGKCAICGRTESGSKSGGAFAVDHDHRTRKVRGLLCLPCNGGIGQLGDSIDTLARAIEYLRKAEAENGD